MQYVFKPRSIFGTVLFSYIKSVVNGIDKLKIYIHHITIKHVCWTSILVFIYQFYRVRSLLWLKYWKSRKLQKEKDSQPTPSFSFFFLMLHAMTLLPLCVHASFISFSLTPINFFPPCADQCWDSYHNIERLILNMDSRIRLTESEPSQMM